MKEKKTEIGRGLLEHTPDVLLANPKFARIVNGLGYAWSQLEASPNGRLPAVYLHTEQDCPYAEAASVREIFLLGSPKRAKRRLADLGSAGEQIKETQPASTAIALANQGLRRQLQFVLSMKHIEHRRQPAEAITKRHFGDNPLDNMLLGYPAVNSNLRLLTDVNHIKADALARKIALDLAPHHAINYEAENNDDFTVQLSSEHVQRERARIMRLAVDQLVETISNNPRLLPLNRQAADDRIPVLTYGRRFGGRRQDFDIDNELWRLCNQIGGMGFFELYVKQSPENDQQLLVKKLDRLLN